MSEIAENSVRKYNEINCESIRIGLASPDRIREWSCGEVKKAETINYRNLKPEKDGLFCETIFGPVKDFECHCGKYKRKSDIGKVCERCGVEITSSKVRRERMGHIELACPVSHLWYFKGSPSRIALLLDIKATDLESVLYYQKYIVINPGVWEGRYPKKSLITQVQYDDCAGDSLGDFCAMTGAEAIKVLLQELSEVSEDSEGEKKTLLEIEREKLVEKIADSADSQTKNRMQQRLATINAFVQSGNKPEWMILDVLPVIPPDLRPMVQLDGGRFATSDLNDLYRRVLARNNRLRELINNEAPEVIVRNEKRMVQDAVDALIDNGKHGRPVTGQNNREYKSLSDMLKGKQGRFRQNLLGKRVDYSGRSVIVVGPTLKMHQCGLPKEMALELFKPFVMNRLVQMGKVDKSLNINNVKGAKKEIDRMNPKVWDALEEVIKDHPVMLNRAPTLHRLGIQAFEPVLVEGRAIKLHPLVCTAFNADFDGDQMAVHVPLSVEAQAEARFLMLASNNLLKPSDGRPVAVPSQDMVLGSYYLTLERDTEPGAGKMFVNKNEATLAYESGLLGLHAPIRVRLSRVVDGKEYSAVCKTTYGRLIFNEPIPQDIGIVTRDPADPESMVKPEIDYVVGKKALGQIIDKCIEKHKINRSAEILDDIKNLGYKFSTRSGITVSVFDAVIPEKKKELVAEAEAQQNRVNEFFKMGYLTEEKRYKAVTEIWENCTKLMEKEIKGNIDTTNPIHIMLDSGARGSPSQLNQLAGMRGTIRNAVGQVIEIPIKSNYREGLNILEYFISSRGARKGLADTALRTADSGYLTRRLVDVAQEIIVLEEDCKSRNGFEVEEIVEEIEGKINVCEPLEERLAGRYLVEAFYQDENGSLTTLSDLIRATLTKEQLADDIKADALVAQKREEFVKETGYAENAAELVFDGKTYTLAVSADHYLSEKEAKAVVNAGVRKTKIRSVLTCEAKHGVCRKCYGKNLATNREVSIGEAVGVVAAQSIGEPGTQLTMRTFHTGGVATTADITRGLPRVEEIFEARKPKTVAFIAGADGVLRFNTQAKSSKFEIYDPDDFIGAVFENNSASNENRGGLVSGEHKGIKPIYTKKEVPVDCIRVYENKKKVNVPDVAPTRDGDLSADFYNIKKGEILTLGSKDPKDVLDILGEKALLNYLINEVQMTYRSQKVDLNDKHIEVIIRQMLRKVDVIDGGSTGILSGTRLEKAEFFRLRNEAKAKAEAENTDFIEPQYKPVLLGITRASLASPSFLSAASFQETQRVLTEAAISGMVDPLMGLKENVILGKLLPSGTGMKLYNNVEIRKNDSVNCAE